MPMRVFKALPLESVTHRIIKPPPAWKGTPAEALADLDALA
jgi:aspartate dehydrogenase